MLARLVIGTEIVGGTTSLACHFGHDIVTIQEGTFEHVYQLFGKRRIARRSRLTGCNGL